MRAVGCGGAGEGLMGRAPVLKAWEGAVQPHTGGGGG